MSHSPSAPHARKGRDLALITVGTVIVVATYLYLVLARPTELADTATNQAGLIAIAGYVIGAVLIAAGSIHRLPTTTIAMIPIAIAINIVVGQIVNVIGLPVYLDAIGTVLVAVVAGPAAGVVTGILTNVIWGLTLNPIMLPFAVVQVIIGFMAGYAARMGMFRKIYLAPIAGVVTGLVAAILSAPMSAYLFGGTTSAGTGALVGAFQAMGQSLLGATTLQGLLSDPLDKLVTFLITALILLALPSRFLARFPFARQYDVLARAGSGPKRSDHSADQSGQAPTP